MSIFSVSPILPSDALTPPITSTLRRNHNARSGTAEARLRTVGRDEAPPYRTLPAQRRTSGQRGLGCAAFGPVPANPVGAAAGDITGTTLAWALVDRRPLAFPLAGKFTANPAACDTQLT
ncbi:hypothetical protein XACS584_1890009 [Xanthomonas citri pv. citri]|nr:hypothetical protein XACS584_1890009 [Xanthomonas citri pv. citri]